MGVAIAGGSGAAMGKADPLDLNNQPRSQQTRDEESAKTKTRVATETRAVLDRTESTARTHGRTTPSPSAPFQFDPVRR